MPRSRRRRRNDHQTTCGQVLCCGRVCSSSICTRSTRTLGTLVFILRSAPFFQHRTTAAHHLPGHTLDAVPPSMRRCAPERRLKNSPRRPFTRKKARQFGTTLFCFCVLLDAMASIHQRPPYTTCCRHGCCWCRGSLRCRCSLVHRTDARYRGEDAGGGGDVAGRSGAGTGGAEAANLLLTER